MHKKANGANTWADSIKIKIHFKIYLIMPHFVNNVHTRTCMFEFANPFNAKHDHNRF